MLVVHPLAKYGQYGPCNSDLRLATDVGYGPCNSDLLKRLARVKTRQSPVGVMQGCYKDALRNVRMLVRVCVCVRACVCVCM